VDLDFDLSDDGGAENTAGDEEDTVLRDEHAVHEATSSYDSEDETLMPGSEESGAGEASHTDDDSEDETLMPGEFDLPDEDETLRHDSSEESFEDVFDLTDVEKKENDDDKNKG